MELEFKAIKYTFRHWTIYFACWIPYALSYVAVFFAQTPNQLLPEIRIALLNVVPAALSGVLVIKLCERLEWNLHCRFWFFPAHLIFAIGYSCLWYTAVLLFLTVDLSLRTNQVSPVWFGGYALQWQLFSGLMIYGTIASVIYVLQIAENLAFEKMRAARAEKLAVEAQFAALRAQLNPHFLFNTLHSLMALVRYAPDKAEDALERLAEMLRYVLNGYRETSATLVTLREERHFVENYLELEKLRLGERLTIVNKFDSNTLDCLLPALTLQPLVENAIKHGIAPRARIGTIYLLATRNNENLELEVRDTGRGTLLEPVKYSQGLGLSLVRRQLQTHYGDQMELKIETEPEQGFAVTIKIPWQTIEKQKTEIEKIAYSLTYH